MKLNTSIIGDEKGFMTLRQTWNGLLERGVNRAVYLSHEWMTAWWTGFGHGSTMRIMVFSNGAGETVGIAPLMLTETRLRGLRARKLSLMANGHSPCGDIIAREGWLEPVVDSLLDNVMKIADWDFFAMEKVYEGGAMYSAVINALRNRRIRHSVKDSIETPYITVDSSWEDFFDKRSARFRKSMRNKINRAARSGGITVDSMPLESSESDAFCEILSVSGESWKRDVRGDLNSNMQNYLFYKTLTDLLGSKGFIELWLLNKDGRAIAFEYHLKDNGIVYPLRADYNRRFRHLSPGSVLEYNILKTFFNNSTAREYNTCGHTYHYLLNWSKKTRKFKNILVYNGSLRSRIMFDIEQRAVPALKKLIRRNGNISIKSWRG